MTESMLKRQIKRYGNDAVRLSRRPTEVMLHGKNTVTRTTTSTPSVTTKLPEELRR